MSNLPQPLYGSGIYGDQPVSEMPLSYYQNLLTSQYRNNSPKLNALLTALLQKYVDISAVQTQMFTAWDINLGVGAQLDTIGLIVGVSRQMKQPVVSAGVTYTLFPDAQYQTLLKLQIAQNGWNGTIPGLYGIWNTSLGALGYGMSVADFQDMSMAYVFSSLPTDPILRAIFSQGYFDLRPAGVLLRGYYVPSAPSGSPTFAWNIETPPTYAGWNQGYWLYPIQWQINLSGFVNSLTQITWTNPTNAGFPVGTHLLITSPGITPPLGNYIHTVTATTTTGFVTDNPSSQPSSEVISPAIAVPQ